MASTATLTTLTARAANLLMDVSAVIFASATIQEGIALALEEFNSVRAQEIIGTKTPTASNKIVSLSTLTGLLSVSKVWFPYTAATPEDPPNELRNWYLHWSAGVPELYLGDGALSPGGSDVARIFYTIPHTLNGLASAVTTTYPAIDDKLLVLGGAGYACMGRSIDLAETAASQAVSTPNYAAIGRQLLDQFRFLLHGE